MVCGTMRREALGRPWGSTKASEKRGVKGVSKSNRGTKSGVANGGGERGINIPRRRRVDYVGGEKKGRGEIPTEDEKKGQRGRIEKQTRSQEGVVDGEAKGSATQLISLKKN